VRAEGGKKNTKMRIKEALLNETDAVVSQHTTRSTFIRRLLRTIELLIEDEGARERERDRSSRFLPSLLAHCLPQELLAMAMAHPRELPSPASSTTHPYSCKSTPSNRPDRYGGMREIRPTDLERVPVGLAVIPASICLLLMRWSCCCCLEDEGDAPEGAEEGKPGETGSEDWMERGARGTIGENVKLDSEDEDREL
jgi:hypothetical protein